MKEDIRHGANSLVVARFERLNQELLHRLKFLSGLFPLLRRPEQLASLYAANSSVQRSCTSIRNKSSELQHRRRARSHVKG